MLPDVGVRYRTKYIDVAPLADAPVCAGTLAMMDYHIEHMLDLMGLELDERIQMYLVHPGGTTPEVWCKEWTMNDHAIGCFAGRAVYTGMAGVPHELIHAITIPEGGGSWWIEGVAYGLSGGQPYPDWLLPPNFGVEVWVDERGMSGHFARWLIERFGGPIYMELYERTPRGADRAIVEDAVRDVLGMGFAEVLSEYAATAAYGYPDHWACYVPSDAVASPWEGDFWTHEVTLDCDSPNTFNNEDVKVHRMTARIPVTIVNPGTYRFIADDPEAEVSLQPCLTAPKLEFDQAIYNWPIAQSTNIGASRLEPGPYVLIVNAPPGAPRTIRLAGYLSIGETDVP